jgi:putative membrane protein
MNHSKRGIAEYLKLFFSGLAMGVANVIPGVSGGTMAFILGIYEELIDSIRKFASVDTLKMLFSFKLKKMYETLPWQFLVAVGVGVLFAIASIAKVLTYSLENYQSITFAFFFGLIIASIITVLKSVKKWSLPAFIWLIVGTLVAFLIVTLVPVDTPHSWWNLFICGMIIICAMILPGISGSFLLLILGQYKFVLAALNLLISVPVLMLKGEKIPDSQLIIDAFVTLAWISSGCIIGLGAFSHFLNWLFKKYHDITVATLIGFMIGSLWKLWPWQEITEVMVKAGKQINRFKLPQQLVDFNAYVDIHEKVSIKTLVSKNVLPQNFDSSFFIAIGVAVFGFIMVVIMEKMASTKDDTPSSGGISE